MAGIYYNDHLIRKAKQHMAAGRPIPLDLFAEMNDAGMDVAAIEKQITQQLEQK